MAISKISCRPVVLVGFMASGKTAVGRRLARRLDLPFADTDLEVERGFGLTVAEVFSVHGEPAFRAAEQYIVTRLLDGVPRVLSLGGGAFADPSTRSLCKTGAATIWLDPPFELILERLQRSRERPLANVATAQELRSLWEERRPLYAEAAIRIESSGDDPDFAVGQVIAALC